MKKLHFIHIWVNTVVKKAPENRRDWSIQALEGSQKSWGVPWQSTRHGLELDSTGAEKHQPTFG